MGTKGASTSGGTDNRAAAIRRARFIGDWGPLWYFLCFVLPIKRQRYLSQQHHYFSGEHVANTRRSVVGAEYEVESLSP